MADGFDPNARTLRVTITPGEQPVGDVGLGNDQPIGPVNQPDPAVQASDAFLNRRANPVDPNDEPSLIGKIADLTARAGEDVYKSVITGEVGYGAALGLSNAGLEIYRLLGAEGVYDTLSSTVGSGKDFQQTKDAIKGAKEGMDTVTGAVAAEASPYVANAIMAMMGVNTWVAQLGYSRPAQALVYLGADKVSDFLTGSLMENPDDGNMMNMIRELSRAKPDSQLWQALRPLAEFLAADPEDSELEKRLKRGAVEALTNVFGDIGIVIGKFGVEPLLDWMKRTRTNGSYTKTADTLIAAGERAKDIEAQLLEEGKQGIKMLYGGGLPVDPRQIDRMMLKGAGKLGQAMKSLEARVKAGMSPLPIDPDAAAQRAARKQKRAGKVAADGSTKIPGEPVNEHTVLEPPPGSNLPVITVGKGITTEDWVRKVEGTLSPEEIDAAARWYGDVERVFEKYVGKEEAPIYMAAWLVANKNVDPAGAMLNTMRASEKLSGEAVYQKQAGLSEDTLKKLFLDELRNDPRGIGQKLYDFVDSALGRETRTFYGDEPSAGAPAVIDVHSFRDMGGLDETYARWLEKNYGAKGLKPDLKGDSATPSETQYEYGADKIRGMTQDLNAQRWRGRDDWTPAEVQAVGWAAQTKLTGEFQDPEAAMMRNLRRVSFELAPGEGSPFAEKFGDRFSKLPEAYKAEVTQNVLERAHAIAERISGTKLQMPVFGSGGWQDYPPQPARVSQPMASPEGAELYANAVGYLAQQTEVWVNSVGMKSGNATAIDIVEKGTKTLEDDLMLRAMWARVREADPTGLIEGFQPIRTPEGDVGIRVLVLGQGKKAAALEQEAFPVIRDVLSEGNTEYIVNVRTANVVRAGNDWKENPDGKGYLERLEGLGGQEAARRVRDHRRELETIFGAELERVEARLGIEAKPAKKGRKQGLTKPDQSAPAAQPGAD